MAAPASARRLLEGRVLVVASRFNEGVTRKLLDGARDVLLGHGLQPRDIDVVWVPGAFELPLAVHRGLQTGDYRIAVAVGAVIRGETAHFDFIAREATQGIGQAAIRFATPVGFGLLTCETLEQALARAGGSAGNKGAEAAQAAVETALALEVFDRGAQG